MLSVYIEKVAQVTACLGNPVEEGGIVAAGKTNCEEPRRYFLFGQDALEFVNACYDLAHVAASVLSVGEENYRHVPEPGGLLGHSLKLGEHRNEASAARGFLGLDLCVILIVGLAFGDLTDI